MTKFNKGTASAIGGALATLLASFGVMEDPREAAAIGGVISTLLVIFGPKNKED